MSTIKRDMRNERELTRRAVADVANPEPIIAFAESRAARAAEYVDDATELRIDRDFVRDALEELADARNYLVWAMQAHPQPEKEHLLEALKQVVGAYNTLLPPWNTLQPPD